MRVKNITDKLPKGHPLWNCPVAFPHKFIAVGQVVELVYPDDLALVEDNVKLGFIEIVDDTPNVPVKPELPPEPDKEDVDLMNLHWKQITKEVAMIRDLERLGKLAELAEQMDKPKAVKEAIAERIEEIKREIEPNRAAVEAIEAAESDEEPEDEIEDGE